MGVCIAMIEEGVGLGVHKEVLGMGDLPGLQPVEAAPTFSSHACYHRAALVFGFADGGDARAPGSCHHRASTRRRGAHYTQQAPH